MDTMTNILMKLYLKNWKIPLAQLGGQILRLITSRGRHLTTLKVSDLFKVNMNMLNIFWANTVKFFNYILDTCQNLGDNSAKDIVQIIVQDSWLSSYPTGSTINPIMLVFDFTVLYFTSTIILHSIQISKLKIPELENSFRQE